MIKINGMKKRWFILFLILFSILFTVVYYKVIKLDVGDLISAALNNDITKINQCLQSGVKVNDMEKWGWHRDNLGRTPLTAALESANIASVKLLIRSGANVNLPDGFGETPASVAARRGDPAIILLLSEAGADFKITYEKLTPLEWAEKAGHQEAARLIEKITEAK